MKMKKLYKRLILAMIAGVMTVGLVSCEKFNDWEVDGSHDRLFRPSEVTADIDGVTATLKWRAKPNTGEYLVELSKDSLLFSQIENTYRGKTTKTADGYYFEIPDLLAPNTRYSARIKGVDTTGVKPESEWAVVTFLTKTEQIMFAVTPEDLTINSVVLKWKVPNQVSHIMIGTNKYDISAPEKAAGQKTITGLAPETAYEATLYQNASIRGMQSFSTPANLPTGDDVVYVKATDDLGAMISAATSETIFVLLKGTVYNSDSEVALPAVPITIWGQDGSNKPIVAFNGMRLPASVGTIRFENIDFTGYPNGDPTATRRNYIFNQSAATNTGEIIFENCIIRNFVNSPMRMQGSNTISIGKFTVNRCLVYDITNNETTGAYAFINNNVKTSKIDNISITNSTFYRIGYGLILHNSAPSLSVKLENNTFDNVTGDGRMFIDYNAQTVGTFSIKNSIIGKTFSPAGTAKGIRYSGSNLTVVNSYKTTDAVYNSNAIPGINDYNKASTDLFTDPAKADFTIKDKSFEGISDSGDPRWRP